MVTSDGPEYHQFGGRLSSWAAMRRGARAHRITFAQALLQRRSVLPYAAYRLRYFLFTNFALLCLHVVELYLLAFDFKHSTPLYALLTLRVVSHALKGAWWGALEIMRQRIRDLNASSKLSLLAHELGCWHRAGLIVAGVTVVTAIACSTLALVVTGAERLVACYAAAILLELATSFVLTLRRSGISAMRRIPQTSAAMIIAPLAGVSVLLMLWPTSGGYALIASSLLTSMISAATGFYYTQLAYTNNGWPRLIWPSRTEFTSFLKGLPVREIGLAAIACGSIHAESLILPIVSYAFHPHGTFTQSLLPLFVALPLLRACSDWARLFYVDLARFEVSLLTDFMRSFHRRLLLASLGVGFVLWLPTLAFSITGSTRNEFIGQTALLALFVWRGQFAWLQMVAFFRKLYWPLIACGGMISGAVTTMGLSWSHTEYRALVSSGIVALCLAMTAFLWGRLRVPVAEPQAAKGKVSETRAMTHLDWLRAVRSSHGEASVVRIEVSALASADQKKALIATVFPLATMCRMWTWLDQQTALGFLLHESSSSAMHEELATGGGGLIRSTKCTEVERSGYDALQRAYHLGFFAVPDTRVIPEDIAAVSDVHELVSLFAKRFPQGQCFKDGVVDMLNGGLGTRFGFHPRPSFDSLRGCAVETLDIAQVWQHVRRFLLIPANRFPKDSLDISMILNRNGTPVVFCIPVTPGNRQSAIEWRLSMYWWNVRRFALRADR
jgi:hypothetical protein